MNKHVDRLKVMFGASEVGRLAIGDRGQILTSSAFVGCLPPPANALSVADMNVLNSGAKVRKK